MDSKQGVKTMSKSLKEKGFASREMQDTQFKQIIETARSIIDKYADDGYPRGERRHPIFGYINFLVRRFIYNDVFDDIAKDGCRRLSSYSIVNMNNWILLCAVIEYARFLTPSFTL